MSGTINLNVLPRGLDEIIQIYGDPDRNGDGAADPDWWRENMERHVLPWKLRKSWGNHAEVDRQWVHKLVAPSLVDALAEIGDAVPPEYLRRCNLDRFGGLCCLRPKRRGGDELSTHSWGIAIDLNPHIAPLGGPSRQPAFIVEAFTRRGWVWLGDADGMHFQACTGY